MKYIFLYLSTFILLIPPVIMGCGTWLWQLVWSLKFNARGFHIGSQWLDEKFNYGHLIDNLINKF